MSDFLKKVAVFLTIPLILVLISDVYLRNKSSLYKEKYRGALETANELEILILGNSHANYGVDPAAFDNYAYNLANVNQSIYFDKRLAEKLLPRLKNLKFVLINVSYHSFSFSSQGARDIWSFYGHGIKYKDKNYILEQLSPTLFAYPLKVILSYLKRDVINHLIYNGNGVNFPVQKGVSIKDSIQNGYIGFEGRNRSRFLKNKYKERAVIFNSKVRNSRNTIDVIDDLDSFIERLIAQGITPVLFTTPTYSEYNIYLNSELLKETKGKIKQKAKKFDIPYWDFMNLDSFKIENFYDMDHLNKEGAYKFSQILNDSINTFRK